jgi:hypothetical protein
VVIGAYKSGVTSPIICKPDETLSHKNYIEVVLPHAQSEDKRLLDDDFIFQQDNATPHTHRELLAWCEKNLIQFINKHRWPPNSPDLNVLNYYVWDPITNHMQYDKVKNYDTLIDEVKNEFVVYQSMTLLVALKNGRRNFVYFESKSTFTK